MNNKKIETSYWAGEPYSEVLGKVITALSSKESLIAVTGPVGIGKTALAHEIQDTLTANGDAVLFFATPPKSNAELHRLCLQQYAELDRFAFMVALEKWLIQLNKNKHRCVLIVDNAHLLNAEVITTIRVMNNLQSATHRLLQVVLLGESTMFKVLSHPQSGGFSQRLSLRATLPAMDKGALKGMLFDMFGVTLDDSALSLAFKMSAGKPGVAVQIGQLLAAQEHSGSINKRFFIQNISKDKTLGSLMLKHRLVGAIPLLAVVVAGLLLWQFPFDRALQNKPSIDSPKNADPTAQNSAPIPTKTSTEVPTKAPTEMPTKMPASMAEKEISDSDTQMPKLAVDNDSNKSLASTQPSESTTNSADSTVNSAQTTDIETAANADANDPNNTDSMVIPVSNRDDDQPTAPQVESLESTAPTDTNSEQPLDQVVSPLEQALTAAVQNWLDSWQTKQIAGYLAAYSADFKPTNGDSHELWQEKKTTSLQRPGSLDLSFHSLKIIEQSPNSVLLQLWLNYNSPNYQDQTLKELTMIEVDGRWVIDKELNKLVKHGEEVYQDSTGESEPEIE